MPYDKIINALKRKRPEPPFPQQLTDRIMNSIEEEEQKKNIFRGGNYESRLITGARVVLSLAAAFFIVFFILEQKGINEKLEKLEERVSSTLPPNRVENIQEIRYRELNAILSNSFPEDSSQEILQINRRTLDYLLARIRNLESENLSIRERLENYYSDSLTIKKPENENP